MRDEYSRAQNEYHKQCRKAKRAFGKASLDEALENASPKDMTSIYKILTENNDSRTVDSDRYRSFYFNLLNIFPALNVAYVFNARHLSIHFHGAHLEAVQNLVQLKPM